MKDSTKSVFKSHFSATHIAFMALFTALAFVVTFLEFPIFPPPANFLKLDFANVFFMIEGFIFGPVEAIVSIGIKEVLCLMKSSSGGVGELANFIMSTAYILIPSVVYRFKKGRWWVTLYLVAACVLQISVSLPVNRYINFPFFAGAAAEQYFAQTWQYVLAFNAIKSVGVSVIVFIIYKPLARFIRMVSERLSRKNRKKRVFKLHLAEQYFPLIASGEKTVEVRLNDKKRRKIQIGDILSFSRNGEKKESLRARVVALHPYTSFEALFSTPDMLAKAGFAGMNAEEASAVMYEFYKKEQEKKSGVLGIEIEVVR